VDRTGKLIHVIGIYEERIAKFLRRAGEAAQNKHAAIVFPGGDEFLGHEVHAVVERCDQADRGRAIEAGNLFVGMVPLEKDDGLPTPGFKACVDAVRFDAYFLKKLFVAGDIGTAGSADLDKTEPLQIGRIIFQEAFDSAEAFENSLGVIHAIHADAEERGFNAELFA